MLIYNAQKKFVGIDQKSLNLLGFSTLETLMQEVDDFADLFVKTPGFIHNFRHVHWIDFVACANPGENSQAIIHINNKNYKCNISVETLFLTESASQKSFGVHLNGLRELSKRESEDVSQDTAVRPLQADTTIEENSEILDVFDTPDIEKAEKVETPKVLQDPYEMPLEVDFDSDDDFFDIEEESGVSAMQTKGGKDSLEDEKIQIDDFDTVDIYEDEPKKEIQQEQIHQSDESGYVYDPHVASEDLGLPLDLIEEFIQDFIVQAREFKPEIYSALDMGEFDQVKTLSHKLKGVAANLRIEDAFEALSIVNTSQSSDEILQNLDKFYNIIAKLAGEEVSPLNATASPNRVSVVEDSEPAQESDDVYDNLLEIDLEPEDDKQEENKQDVSDDDVPQKIDIAELADDDFVSTDIDFKDIEGDIKEIDEIDDIDLIELDSIEDNEEEIQSDIASDAQELEYQQEELLVDVAGLKERAAGEIGIDLESYDELLKDYLGESESIVERIKSAVAQKSFDTCRYEAMVLQGMSENMRVDNFEKELQVLSSAQESSASDELLGAISSIQTKLKEISRAGA